MLPGSGQQSQRFPFFGGTFDGLAWAFYAVWDRERPAVGRLETRWAGGDKRCRPVNLKFIDFCRSDKKYETNKK